MEKFEKYNQEKEQFDEDKKQYEIDQAALVARSNKVEEGRNELQKQNGRHHFAC